MSELSSPHIGQLLRDAHDRFEVELMRGTPPFGGNALRPTHNHVLRYLDRDGTRASVIAERAGLTRQAITQIVDELERVGVVERRPDPDDGRAKQIVYTPAGLAAFDRNRGVIAAIEERWRKRLGAAGWEAMRAALADIARD